MSTARSDGIEIDCTACGKRVTLPYVDSNHQTVSIGGLNGWVVDKRRRLCPTCALTKEGP